MFEIFKKVRLTKQQISAIEKLEKDGFYRFLTVKQQLKAEKERSIRKGAAALAAVAPFLFLLNKCP